MLNMISALVVTSINLGRSIALRFGGLSIMEGGSVATILEFGAGIFSLVLLAVTLYAWFRRGRQPTLLIVSFAFLTFFIRQTLEILPFDALHTELASSLLDFLTLALFFIALVMPPKRTPRIGDKLDEAEPLTSNHKVE